MPAPNRFYPLPVASVRRETADCVVVELAVPPELGERFAYRAGQYLTVRAVVDGEELRRSYSLCTAPHEGTWRVAIKRVDDGAFSTYANTRLAAGDVLEAMAPQGSFQAPETGPGEVLLVAAGSGITPVVAIAKQLLYEQPGRPVTLVYGNRATADILFREEIEGLKNLHLTQLRVYHVLSREDQGIALLHGRIDADKVAAFAKTLFDPTQLAAAYLCGPAPMIEAATETLAGLGLPRERIHFELFGAPVVPAAGLSRPTVVRAARRAVDAARIAVTLDHKTVTIEMLDDGSHLLETGLSFGLDLPYACKAGVCSTCKCRVTEGEVVMDVNYALEPDEVAEGFVLSCQSRPVSSVVAVTFDV